MWVRLDIFYTTHLKTTIEHKKLNTLQILFLYSKLSNLNNIEFSKKHSSRLKICNCRSFMAAGLMLSWSADIAYCHCIGLRCSGALGAGKHCTVSLHCFRAIQTLVSTNKSADFVANNQSEASKKTVQTPQYYLSYLDRQ